MKNGKLLLAATLLASTMMAGAMQSGSANAAPLIAKPQLSEVTTKNSNVQDVGLRKRRFKRFVKRHVRGWRWCRNHPRRCRGHRYRWGGYGHPARGALCHRHIYKVPGMHFHSRVRCDHRHYRAYRSWEWVR